jgi:hypothetical protein
MVTRDRRRTGAGLIIGAVLVLIGGFYLLSNTFGLDLEWDAVWPIAVIVLGGAVILGALARASGEERRPGPEPKA